MYKIKRLLLIFLICFLSSPSWALPPSLNPIDNKIIFENELLEFAILASDPDGDALTYTVDNLPIGSNFDHNTQIFTWIPGFEQSGYNSMSVTVSDGTASDQISIIIDVVDAHPLEAPTGLAAITYEKSIILSWNSIIQDELSGYNIYRSTSDNGKYEKINNDLITDTEYDDFDVSPETYYHYFITAVDVFNHSEVFADGLPVPLSLTFNDDGQLFASSFTEEGVIWNIDYHGNSSVYVSGLRTIGDIIFKDENLYFTEYEYDAGAVKMITPERDIYSYGESLVLKYPFGLAFNSIGELFVTEDFNGKIYKILSDETNWELFYSGLDGPGDIIFDELENLVVAEDLWIGANWIGAINLIDSAGNLSVLANLTDPDGICSDRSGNLYVGQSHMNQVSKVMPDGSSVPIIQNITPWGCGVNKYNELLVTLPWDDQILKIHLTHESDISDKVQILAPYYNIAPILNTIGSKVLSVGELLEFIITATDDNGENLTYSANNLPSGASFDSATGIFTWTPASNQAGVYPNVLFTVTDDGSPVMSDSESITITVGDVIRPPVLAPVIMLLLK